MRERDRKETSKISLHMISSTGTWLNESDIPQRRYVEIRMNDPEGRLVGRAAMTLDQFATFLVSNSECVCTLVDYRDGSKLLHEEVEVPETVMDRMTRRLGKSHKELLNRIEDLEKDVYEMVNGGSKGKKKLEELLLSVRVVREHYSSNKTFTVQKAQEEVDKIQDNMRAQILNVASGLGMNVGEEDIKALEGNRENLLMLNPSEKDSVPVVSDYEKKKRDVKLLEEMTAMEVADEISRRLIILSNQQKGDEKMDGDERVKLFMTSATPSKNNVHVKYISYQGHSSLTLREAKDYLKFLRGVDKIEDFKTHHWYKK